MTWITPKTDWKAADVLLHTDLNRIEENDLHLHNIILFAIAASSLQRKNKDLEGIFTLLEWRRPDGTLWKTSQLSGGTSPRYTTRTVKYYAENGLDVTETIVYSLSYDINDELVSEVVQS